MPAAPPSILSVSQLTRRIRTLLEDDIGEIWVEGEISNHRLQSSGHQYFTLKDESAQLSCVLFRGASTRLPAPLRDGQQVQIHGGLTVYEQRGNYQIIVRLVQPKGLGSLQARFEALKQKLNDEGLFDPRWKKPVPRLPRCVALVTSPTGAAIQDMLHVLTRRAPWVRVLIYPVRVQGQGAEQEIAQAIAQLNRAADLGLPVPDTIVIGRGGGSLEDLWSFNEETLARAIFASTIPVISAVGHEIDFTISDFVADLRAPTPSAAAELLAPDAADLRRHFDSLQKTLSLRLHNHLDQHQRRLDHAGKGTLQREPARLLRDAEQSTDALEDRFHRALENLWRHLDDHLTRQRHILDTHQPRHILADARHRAGMLHHRLATLMRQRLDQASTQITAARKLLHTLGPDAVLARGFSLTTDARGQLITTPGQVRTGDMIITRLGQGKIASVVTPNK